MSPRCLLRTRDLIRPCLAHYPRMKIGLDPVYLEVEVLSLPLHSSYRRNLGMVLVVRCQHNHA